MSDAKILLVDKHDKPIGTATKPEIWEKGLWHRISRIMVEDKDGRILLQKRADDMQLYPGRWDDSAAGHVDEGEDYETAARRELQEEIGLTNVDLQEVGTYTNQIVFEWRKMNRFNRVYKIIVDHDIKTVLNPEEVSEVKWFTPEQAKKLVTEHPDQVTDGLQDVINRYY